MPESYDSDSQIILTVLVFGPAVILALVRLVAKIRGFVRKYRERVIDLKRLRLDNIPELANWSAANSYYDCVVPNKVTSTKVLPEFFSRGSNCDITVTHLALTEPKKPVPIALGDTVVDVRVRHEQLHSTRIYTVTVRKDANALGANGKPVNAARPNGGITPSSTTPQLATSPNKGKQVWEGDVHKQFAVPGAKSPQAAMSSQTHGRSARVKKVEHELDEKTGGTLF